MAWKWAAKATILAVVLACSLASAQANEVVLGAPTSYPVEVSGDGGTGDIVRSFAACDIDGDGDADVVVSGGGGYVASLVWVFLNLGDGTFGQGVSVEAGAAPLGIAIADIDGDSHLDVVLANNSSAINAVTLLRNSGTDLAGTWMGFDDPQNYGIGRGQEGSNGIVTADFNGDQLPDVATANRSAGSVSVLFNDGEGGFQAPVVVDFPIGVLPQGIAATDVDDDGDIDLATANINSISSDLLGAAILLNDDDGFFTVCDLYEAGPNPYSIVPADFNHDGKVDLTVSSNAPAFMLTNPGSCLFASAAIAGSSGGYDIIAPDLNGDYWPDLVWSHFAGIETMLNDGHGAFIPSRTWELAGDAREVTATVTYSDGTEAPLDLNGDGRADLLVLGRNPERFAVFLNETPLPCVGDINQNGGVNIDDLLLVIALWGPCSIPFCTVADTAPPGGNGIVNTDDLLAVINGWGPCP